MFNRVNYRHGEHMIDTNSAPLTVRVEEAAKRAGVSRGLLYSEISRGRLRVRKAGRRTLITVNDLTAWLNALPTRADKRQA
jgi:excisionase family DNA binding protein